MPNTKILVVDDEQSILNLVTAYLRQEGYEVHTAMDGPGGLKAARAFKPDLIVLDVMLPGMDGIELLTHLRRESEVYVIMLTAKSEETDKIIGLSRSKFTSGDGSHAVDSWAWEPTLLQNLDLLGLSVGADDYLTKPFSPRELVARVKAALRRYGQKGETRESQVLVFKHIRIDLSARQIWKDDQPIELTAIEFDLLYALAEHRGRVLSREQLLEHVWGHDFYGEERVVDVHLGHIRKKIEPDPAHPELIVTVRGVGYRFEDETL